MLIKKYNLFLQLIMCFGLLFSNNLEKERISVLPFTGWSGEYNNKKFTNSLTDKIVTRIIESHRFSVIDRKNLDQIMKEQKLQLSSGIIDQSTAIRVGKILGIDKFILGSITRKSTEKHDAKYSAGKKIKDAYYTAEINATIQLLDVETGEYLEATEAKGKGRGKNKNDALSDAIDKVAKNVINGFEEYFKIQAFITGIKNSVVFIDRGSNLGIKEGMSFSVYNKNKNSTTERNIVVGAFDSEIGRLKIVSTETNSAKGRLFGDFSQVQIGNLIRETKENLKIEARIIEKSFGKVVINAGADLGLTEGSTFNVIKKQKDLIDPITGEVYGSKTKKIGKIYLYEVGPGFARGKIIKGRYSIREGMVIKETNRLLPNAGLSVSYGARKTESIKNPSAEYSFSNGNTHYLDYGEDPDINQSTFLRFSFYTRDLAKNNSTHINWDIFDLGEEIKGGSLDLTLSKHIGIIPEFIYLTPGLGVGYAWCRQDIDADFLNDYVGENEGNELKSTSWYVSAKIGARMLIKNLILFADLGYNNINFDEWEYEYKDPDGDEYESSEWIGIDNEYVRYPELKIPYSFDIGFAFEF